MCNSLFLENVDDFKASFCVKSADKTSGNSELMYFCISYDFLGDQLESILYESNILMSSETIGPITGEVVNQIADEVVNQNGENLLLINLCVKYYL